MRGTTRGGRQEPARRRVRMFPGGGSVISVSGLVKRFEGRDFRKTAVQGLNFNVPDGKLFTLLGPSGCGKTTTLRMIAGLEHPSAGEIAVNGVPVYSSEKGIF